MRPQKTKMRRRLQAAVFFTCGTMARRIQFAVFRDAVPDIETPQGKAATLKTKNSRLLKWVEETAALCKPDAIH